MVSHNIYDFSQHNGGEFPVQAQRGGRIPHPMERVSGRHRRTGREVSKGRGEGALAFLKPVQENQVHTAPPLGHWH